MKIIEQNPYRLLGVYSNSPKKEVIANKNKMSAFLKVGKSASFPLDLNGILPPVVRNSENIVSADVAITLPQGQVEAGQFWFIKMSGIDEVAFNHLLAGDIENAMIIWEKKECASSLQNRLVCYLIRGEYKNAIACAERLYGNYLNDLVVAIAGENFTINEDDFIGRFEEVMLSEKVINPMDFMNSVHSDNWKSHLKDAVVEPLLKQISDAIEVSNKVDREDAEASLEAGMKLMNSTKGCLESLRQILPTSDLVYEKIADKLGLRILQCGINYYNASEEEYEPAKKAIVLQKYALAIVVGQMAKDRCKENVEVLKQIVETPLDVINALKYVKECINNFEKKDFSISESCTIVDNIKPYLKILSNFLGVEHNMYLHISTQIVNGILNNIIKEVNDAQEKFTQANYGSLGLGRFDTIGEYNPLGTINSITIYNLSNIVDSAVELIDKLDSFDMETKYRVIRFTKNKESLKKIQQQVNEVIDYQSQKYEIERKRKRNDIIVKIIYAIIILLPIIIFIIPELLD